MPATPTCRPWCENHEAADDSCNRLIFLFTKSDEPDDGDGRESQEQNPAITSLKEQFHGAGLLPDEIDTVFLDVIQTQEDEDPVMLLRFWDSTKDDDSATVTVDLADLRALRASLGRAIKIIE